MGCFRMGRRGVRLAAGVSMLMALGLTLAPGGVWAAEPTSQAVPGATPSTSLPAANAPDAAHSGPGFSVHRAMHGNQEHDDVNACTTLIAPDEARCNARLRTDATARTARPARAGQAQPAGGLGNGGAYDPGYLQSAYNVMSAVRGGAGTGQILAIVDAYDDPNAQSDLAYYRSYFGLPALPDCSAWPASSACFRKTDQAGGTSYPSADKGWSEEISLDLDMASAMCPSCTILLVEASSSNYSDLGAAVNEAVALGANVVSNSYGGSELSGETSLDSYYNHPGVAITVSSGDAGYGTEYPAASPYVTAVGGTSLTQATNTGTRNGSETAWSSAGSGCSAYEAKPSWQKDSGCGKRTVADVSAVADPNTGVWIYDTYSGDTGFEVFGGTSAAAPIVGAVYALAGNSLSGGPVLSADAYAQPAALFDATSGSNGSCGGTYLCTSGAGYDGPTGLGSPNGTAAFTNPVTARPDFSVQASASSVTVTRGGPSASDTLTLNALNGYHSSVQLAASGVPSGVTLSFSANPVTPTAAPRLTVRAGARAAAGTHTVTITASGADGTRHTLSLPIVVK